MFRLIAKIIYTILLFIESIIAIRFILTILQASQKSAFVYFIYQQSSNYFLNPFRSIGIPEQVFFGGFVFDTLALLGLVIYMLLGFILIEIIRAFSD
jgi:hypothetical protein